MLSFSETLNHPVVLGLAFPRSLSGSIASYGYPRWEEGGHGPAGSRAIDCKKKQPRLSITMVMSVEAE